MSRLVTNLRSGLARMLPLPRNRHSVRGKLTAVVLATTAIALLVAGAAMLRHDLGVYRESWAADLATQADILALSTAPALAFDDRRVALRGVAALRARPEVLGTAIYDASGRLYVSYARSGEPALPERLVAGPPGTRITGEQIEVARPVAQNGEFLGTIYLRARYDVAGRVRAYIGILALVMLLSLGVAMLLTTLLSTVITAPLEAMSAVARGIVTRRDYALRARRTSDDEFGLVVDAFNSMLDEVQSRTRALEHANALLESSMAAAEIGSWVWDLRTDEVVADRNLALLYGLDASGEIHGDRDVLMRHAHPDDLERIRAAHRTALATGRLPAIEFRIVRPDGSIRWLAGRGRLQPDEAGRPAMFAGLMIDLTAQKQAEEALRDADRRKDEFLATLAHELRNPLAPIRHAVKLLEARDVAEEQRQWARDVIARQVERMALLLDDLLDVSRITRDRLELRREHIDLRSLVATAIEPARPLLEAKRHVFACTLPDEALVLDVDPLRLSQALSNLLTNAAKYTDAGGRIGLDVREQSGDLVFTVRDSGIGISAAALPRLFEMFSQVESAIDRAEGGLGIGLALVRGLVALHGGSVAARSGGVGRGSEFTIRLPGSVIVRRGSSALAAAPGSAAQVPAATKGRILVVDDNRDAAAAMAMVLELGGHQLFLAYSGQQGLEIGRRERPDAMVLDIGMADLTGYEAARLVRGEPWGRQILLIAVTGWGQEADKAQAKAAGFDHHLTKPADPDRVFELLERHLAQRRAGAGAANQNGPVAQTTGP